MILMPDIIHFLTIEASPAAVYKAITEQAGIQGWWTVQARIEPVIFELMSRGEGSTDLSVIMFEDPDGYLGGGGGRVGIPKGQRT